MNNGQSNLRIQFKAVIQELGSDLNPRRQQEILDLIQPFIKMIGDGEYAFDGQPDLVKARKAFDLISPNGCAEVNHLKVSDPFPKPVWMSDDLFQKAITDTIGHERSVAFRSVVKAEKIDKAISEATLLLSEHGLLNLFREKMFGGKNSDASGWLFYGSQLKQNIIVPISNWLSLSLAKDPKAALLGPLIKCLGEGLVPFYYRPKNRGDENSPDTWFVFTE